MAASFAVNPMLKYVKKLVAMKALKETETADLVTPKKGSIEADHWALIGEVCMQCGEYRDAEGLTITACSYDHHKHCFNQRLITLLMLPVRFAEVGGGGSATGRGETHRQRVTLRRSVVLSRKKISFSPRMPAGR